MTLEDVNTIRYYNNRRLYCPLVRRYVTHFHLIKRIQDGHPITVVEVKTGVNVTRKVLLSAIASHDRRNADRDQFLPTGRLVSLIKTKARAT